MAPYHYESTPNPFAGSIADLILRAGDVTAQGDRAQGQIWGGAIDRSGQQIAAIPGQIAQTKEQEALASLRQSEIDKNTADAQARQRALRGQQLLGTLTQQYSTVEPTTGIPQINHEAIAGDLTKAGYGDEAQKYLQGAASTAESLDKINMAKRATNAAIGESVGKAANAANGPDDFMNRLDHLAIGGAIPADVRQQFAAEVQQAGSAVWDDVKKKYVDWADSVAKPIDVKEGESLVSGVSHTPIVTGAPKEPTVAGLEDRFLQLGVRKKQGQSLAPADQAWYDAYATEKASTAPPKTPAPLDEQLLQAITKGDSATANTITTTMRAAAQAKGDPAAIAAANRQIASINAQVQQQQRAQDFTETQAGRQQLTKIESPFLDAREKADTLRNVVALAKDGNKEAENVQVLLGTLGFVTSEGVKRINTTELQAVAGAGDLFDRVKAKAGKWTSGNPMPEGLEDDLVQLSSMLEKSAANRYQQGFQQITKRYPGLKDEVPLTGGSSTVPDEVKSALKGIAAGRHTLSDGSVWNVDPSGTITKAP